AEGRGQLAATTLCGSHPDAARRLRIAPTAICHLPSALCGSFFLASVLGQMIDQHMQLLLREIDLLRRALDVEEPGAHRDRDLVQVADLREDLLRVLAE